MSDAPRKIAVIVALDVAGYSARTEADEAKTTAEVAALRQVIEGIASAHGGRVFNTAGDGFMLEFASSLAAVEAAFELAEKCEPKVRVGVHVGDVVPQPNGDLLGHGVNVAARLMARAEPGSSLVSADVKRMIRGPVAERLQSRGMFKLDKMAETIEAFALAAVASAMVAASPQTTEPLLAVLPFDNLSNDPEMQFFSDGVSEEIHYALTHGTGFSVIGRTSAFQFRGADKKNAARELKATHILDGALRKSGPRMRLNTQLTEVASGRCLWSDRYDREIADAFALQDEIAGHVASALKSLLPAKTPVEAVDPVAYELFLNGLRYNREFSDDTNPRAESLLLQAVTRAPTFARAWAQLSMARMQQLPRDSDAAGEPMHDAALSAAQRALELDPNNAVAYVALASLKPAFAGHGEKLALIEKAYDLAPQNADVLNRYGGAYLVVGRVRKAFPYFARAAELEPVAPWMVSTAADMLLTLGRTEEAIARINAAQQRLPDSLWIWGFRWRILFYGGHVDEAAQMFAPETPKPKDQTPFELNGTRFVHSLFAMPLAQREAALRTILHPATSPTLQFGLCQIAGWAGCVDLAYEFLLDAIATKRPMGPMGKGRGVNRAFLTAGYFTAPSAPLQRDIRFPKLCAHAGLVDYWRTSGHWPDCADEVPYDFKAECENAARDVAKA